MKLLFLGVMSAFATGEKAFQSNMLIESASEKKLLIDCGTDIRHSLYECGLSHHDIDAAYISHLHADHVGGLEWLGFSTHFIENRKPSLYISGDQKDKLWDHVLSGGMSSIEDQSVDLSFYFDIHAIQSMHFDWEGLSFQLVFVHHMINNHEHLPCYGLFISSQKQTIFITTDTRFHPESLKPFYEKADVIFHDCETSSNTSGQHARYEDLRTLNLTIKEKMWLYDYNSGPLPHATQDGFKGFVRRGQTFDF